MIVCSADSACCRETWSESEIVDFCEFLRRTESNRLGFVPLSTYPSAARRGRLLVVGSEEGLRGFLFWGLRRPAFGSRSRPVVRLHQLAVLPASRRQGIGTRLVNTVMVHPDVVLARPEYLMCRCRSDLEACRFWEALGFENYAGDPRANARKSPVLYYRRKMDGLDGY